MGSVASAQLGLFGEGTTMDGAPLLALPSPEASVEEWKTAFPILRLPKLPPRGEGYWTEPLFGIVLVSMLCLLFVSSTFSIASDAASCADTPLSKTVVSLLAPLSCLWATVAAFCTAYILFGSAGEIQRAPETCYPIPTEVAERLRKGEDLKGLENLHLRDSKDSYCVRCLVWRRVSASDESKSHHCQTCGRCYEGFDHHCGVFGRCIVNANMRCFASNIGMLAAAVVTIGAALVMSCEDELTPEYTTQFSTTAPSIILH